MEQEPKSDESYNERRFDELVEEIASVYESCAKAIRSLKDRKEGLIDDNRIQELEKRKWKVFDESQEIFNIK